MNFVLQNYILISVKCEKVESFVDISSRLIFQKDQISRVFIQLRPSQNPVPDFNFTGK